MARTNIRRIKENPKWALDNFSGGMEYNDHARAKRNNRVKYIKNLELTDDGKLELRKPMVPYLDTNGTISTPLFKDDVEIIKTFFYPSLNNNIKFIWLIKEKDGTYKFVTKTAQGRILDVIVPSTVELNNILDYTYLNYADALYIKFKNAIVKLRIEDLNGIKLDTIKEYNPTSEEIVNVGVNLFNKDPFSIKDALTEDSSSKISGLLWSKKNGDIYEPVYNIKRTDALFLKARLEVSIPQLRNEVKAFDADSTLEAMTPQEANDPANLSKVQIAMPHWLWYKHKTTVPIDLDDFTTKSAHSTYYPMFLTNIDNVINEIKDTTLRDRIIELRQKMFNNGWRDVHTANNLYVGQSNPDDEEYILKIKYEQGYNTSESVVSNDELNTVVKHFRLKTHKQTSTYPDSDTKGWYDSVPSSADMRDVMSFNKNKILAISNFDQMFPSGDWSQKGVHNGMDVFELELNDPTTIVKNIKLRMSDWGNRSFHTTITQRSHTGVRPRDHDYNWKGNPTVTETIYPKKPILPTDKPVEKLVSGYKYTEVSTLDYNGITIMAKTSDDISLYLARNDHFIDAAGTKFGVEIDHLHKFSGIRSGSDIEYFWEAAHRTDTADAITPRNIAWIIGNYVYSVGTRYQDRSFPRRPDSGVEDWIYMAVTSVVPGVRNPVSSNKQYVTVSCPVPSIIKDADKTTVVPKSYEIWVPNYDNSFDIGADAVYDYDFDLDSYTETLVTDMRPGTIVFSTNVYSGLELTIIKDSKPDDVISRGAIIKYSDAPQVPIKFDWELKNSEYLFSYWEKLGVYGYISKPGINLPYNIINLSTASSDNYFPNTSILDVYSNDNHLVTQVLPWKNNLLAFTESSTTMFIGRDAAQKEVISTIYGLSKFNRNTAKVVSNSVVMKSGHEVIAYVPAPGTDSASSLNIRPISQQINPYIEELDNQNPIKVYAHTFKHEYWLVYVFKGKTVVLKYTWDKYAWTLCEYPIELYEMFSLNADITLASDLHGHLYNLTNINIAKDLSLILGSLHKESPLEYLSGDIRVDFPGLSRDVTVDKSTHVVMTDAGDADESTLATLSSSSKAVDVDYVYAYDGDTVTVMIGNDEHKIRVLGVDAPEMRKYSGSINYGEVAKVVTVDALSKAKSIKVIFTGTWTYNREVGRIIYQDSLDVWHDLSYTLLDAGAVRVDYISSDNHSKWYYPNPSYIAMLVSKEKTAETNNLGIWATPADEVIYEHPLMKDYHGLAAQWGIKFKDIDYKLEIGDRKPADDTVSVMADATALIGNYTNSTIIDQKFIILINNQNYRDTQYTIDIPADMNATDWMISNSLADKPYINKLTKQLYKNTDTFNIVLEGTTPNAFYIDGLVATYTNTGRKNFR